MNVIYKLNKKDVKKIKGISVGAEHLHKNEILAKIQNLFNLSENYMIQRIKNNEF